MFIFKKWRFLIYINCSYSFRANGLDIYASGNICEPYGC